MILLAGIPDIYFDRFRTLATRQLSEIGFTGVPLPPLKGKYAVSEEYCEQLIESAVRFAEGRKNSLCNGLGVVILQRSWECERFERKFFPFALVESVVMEAPLHTKGQAKNEIANIYAAVAVQNARKLHAKTLRITKYFGDQIRRTPALLPACNFKSKYLLNSLQAAHDLLRLEASINESIEKAMHGFLNAHPRRQNGKGFVFQDDANIEFKSPPREQFHGISPATSGSNGHKPKCYLTAKLRLGGLFSEGFHYDCTKGLSPLKTTLQNCHGVSETYRGNPHLNIYPNDYVR